MKSSTSPGIAAIFCLLLAGCSDQVARLTVFPDGCKTFAFATGITQTEEKTDAGFKCVIEYRRKK